MASSSTSYTVSSLERALRSVLYPSPRYTIALASRPSFTEVILSRTTQWTIRRRSHRLVLCISKGNTPITYALSQLFSKLAENAFRLLDSVCSSWDEVRPAAFPFGYPDNPISQQEAQSCLFWWASSNRRVCFLHFTIVSHLAPFTVPQIIWLFQHSHPKSYRSDQVPQRCRGPRLSPGWLVFEDAMHL